MKYNIVFVMLILCMFLFGCSSRKTEIPIEYSGNIKDTISQVIDNNSVVVTKSRNIQTIAKEEVVINDAKEIEIISEKSNSLLDNANIELVSNNTYVEGLKKELEQSRNKSKQMMETLFNTLLFLSVIMVISGIAIGIFLNKSLGVTITLIGILSMSVVKFYLIFSNVFVYFGCGIFSLIFLYILYKAYQLFVATKTNIKLIDTIKTCLPEDTKTKVFGDKQKGILGVADTLQSDSTKKIVNDIKFDLKLKKEKEFLNTRLHCPDTCELKNQPDKKCPETCEFFKKIEE